MTELLGFSLPIDHQVMIAEIKRLPTVEVQKDWTRQLKQLHLHCKNKMLWIAKRLDYLQLTQFGFRVPDPVLNDARLNPLSQQEIAVYSNYYFDCLQLLICDPKGGVNGFDLARQKAQEIGKDFPFKHPRELITQAIRLAVDDGFEDILSPGSDSVGLKEIREAARMEGKILRDKKPEYSTYEASKTEIDRFEQDKRLYWEHCENAQDWIRFTFWACEKMSTKKTIKPRWDAMLKSHKQLTAFYTTQGEQNTPSIPVWRNGLPFDRGTSAPLNYQYQL